MATSGEGSTPSDGATTPQLSAPVQHLEPRVVRRRLSQARHRATLVGLFNNLRKTVYSQSDLTASKATLFCFCFEAASLCGSGWLRILYTVQASLKITIFLPFASPWLGLQWQVLNKTKSHIQELEQTLDNLLKLKESFNLQDGNASSLEEVKEEYSRLYSDNDSLVLNSFSQNSSSPQCPTEALRNDDEKEENEREGEEEEDQEEDEEEEEEGEEEKKEDLSYSAAAVSPDLLEFERYLNFYKQTMDLLTVNGIISLQEVTLPIVSAAISHLWQTLSEEKKDSLLQAWEQQYGNLPDLTEACLELACVEGSVKDSGVESQGASGSLASTPEEILFEDAFDVASFLDKSEAPSMSSFSSIFDSENSEEKFQLYMQITEFLKGFCCVNIQVKQEPVPPVDDEMMLLKCLETFDDEDL